MILNGGMKGDEEGEYTYTGGKGETVIDYILGDEDIREKVERLEVGEKVDLDHHPLILWIRGSAKRKRRRKEVEKIRRRGIWNEEGRTQFGEKLEKIGGNRELQDERERNIEDKKSIRGERKREGKGSEREQTRMVGRGMQGEKEGSQERTKKMEERKWRGGKI